MPTPPFTLAPAATPVALDDARRLFRAYATGLGVDLCFQGFEAELADVGRAYGPPGGALLLARDAEGEAVGCVAVHARPDAGEGVCEMKRLYVAPEARGHALGRRLAEALLDEARRLGYRRMVLDTLDTLRPALALYAALGFRPVPAYYANPLPGVVYLARNL